MIREITEDHRRIWDAIDDQGRRIVQLEVKCGTLDNLHLEAKRREDDMREQISAIGEKTSKNCEMLSAIMADANAHNKEVSAKLSHIEHLPRNIAVTIITTSAAISALIAIANHVGKIFGR